MQNMDVEFEQYSTPSPPRWPADRQGQIVWLSFWLLCLLQLILQSQLIVRADQIWADEIARRMIAGGNYHLNFFENNPPMIFFLHVLVRLLATCVHLSGTTAWTLLLFVMTVASFTWISCFLRRLLAGDSALLRAYQWMLLVVFWVVPNINFGQREHVMLCLSLPYFFWQLQRVYPRQPMVPVQGDGGVVSCTEYDQGEYRVFTLMILGVAAGIGLSLKPYFLIPAVLLELAYFFSANRGHRRDYLPFGIILLVHIFYLASIWWLTPEYYREVFLLTLKIYAPYGRLAWYKLFLIKPILFMIALSVVAILLIVRRVLYAPMMVHGLWLTWGFFLSFFLQFKGFDYQGIPMLAASFITLAPVGVSLFKQHCQQPTTILPGVCLAMLFSLGIYPGLEMIPKIVLTNLICRYSPYCEANLVKLIKQTHPHIDSFFMVATHVTPPQVNAYTSGLPHLSRFSTNWFISRLVAPDQRAFRDYIRQMYVDDFVNGRPALVLIDRCRKSYWERGLKQGFSQWRFLRESARFRQAWKRYQPIEHGNPMRACFKAYLRQLD